MKEQYKTPSLPVNKIGEVGETPSVLEWTPSPLINAIGILHDLVGDLRIGFPGRELGSWSWYEEPDRFEVFLVHGYQEREDQLRTVRGRASLEEVIHPEDLPAVMEEMQALVDAIKDGQDRQFSVRHRLRLPDGSWQYVQNIGRPCEEPKKDEPKASGHFCDLHHVETLLQGPISNETSSPCGESSPAWLQTLIEQLGRQITTAFLFSCPEFPIKNSSRRACSAVLQELLHHDSDLIFATDRDMRVVFTNRAMTEGVTGEAAEALRHLTYEADGWRITRDLALEKGESESALEAENKRREMETRIESARKVIELVEKPVSEIEIGKGFDYKPGLISRVLRGEKVVVNKRRILKGKASRFRDQLIPVRDELGSTAGILVRCQRIPGSKKKIVTQDRAATGQQPSEKMREVIEKANLVAAEDSTVLLLGETGTGKDYWARYIHQHSGRSGKPFVPVNTTALPKDLLESELFGYEQGGHSQAAREKPGLIEQAEGGTLFLNEIGDMPLSAQTKLLTFLDTKKFFRLGGTEERSVNVRIMAATNSNLDLAMDEGRFRRDLFFRLNVYPITLPPLRERITDIPLLVKDILRQLASEMGMQEVPELSRSDMDKLFQYHWPGNVRELRSVLERGLIDGEGKRCDLGFFPPGSRQGEAQSGPQSNARGVTPSARQEENGPVTTNQKKRQRGSRPSDEDLLAWDEEFIAPGKMTIAELARRKELNRSSLSIWLKKVRNRAHRA